MRVDERLGRLHVALEHVMKLRGDELELDIDDDERYNIKKRRCSAEESLRVAMLKYLLEHEERNQHQTWMNE